MYTYMYREVILWETCSYINCSHVLKEVSMLCRERTPLAMESCQRTVGQTMEVQSQ